MSMWTCLQMEKYSDGWPEFRTALQATKKKLLKKANHKEALAQFREIAVRMDDQEMPEHAALCHKEMAKIYGELGQRMQEREQWMKAAAHFAAAYAHNQRCQMSVHSHLLEEMESSFAHAIQICVRDSCTYRAGFITLELAAKLMAFHNYPLAFEYLQKAQRFLQNEIYQQKVILDKMCVCTTRMKNFDEALFETTTLFTSVMKGESFLSPVREQLLEVELKLVILHLKQFLADRGERPKSWLATYAPDLPNKPTLMVREEYTPTREFIAAVKSNDALRLHSVYHRDLRPRMDEFGRKLTDDLIASIAPTPSHPELAKIQADGSLSELDKRKAMLEWFNVHRKSRLTYETI